MNCDLCSGEGKGYYHPNSLNGKPINAHISLVGAMVCDVCSGRYFGRTQSDSQLCILFLKDIEKYRALAREDKTPNNPKFRI